MKAILSLSILGLIGSTVLASDPVTGVQKSWEMLPQIRAVYSELFEIFDSPKLSSEGIPVYGFENSETQLSCYAGPAYAKLSWELPLRSKVPGMPKSQEMTELFTQSTIAFGHSNGGGGDVNTRASGMINPLAYGYLAETAPINIVLRDQSLKLVRISGSSFNIESSSYTKKFTTSSDQYPIRIMSLETASIGTPQDPRAAVVSETRIIDEFEYRKFKFPKKLVYETKVDGKVVRRKTWNFIKLLPTAKDDNKISFKEGVNVTDEATGIVYEMKNGKLVPDPVFAKKNFLATTIGRLITVGGVMGVCLSLTLLMRRRKRSL